MFEDMKAIGFYGGAAVIATIVIIGFIFMMRFVSNVATPINVHEVEPGVKCATMVTADGAAIDCWKTE